MTKVRLGNLCLAAAVAGVILCAVLMRAFNLDPGTYTLRVAAINNSSNQSGDITDKEISMQLTISAPWYAT